MSTEHLRATLARLNRGDSPDSKYPDHKGEYWTLCPFHADTHAANFSVSERGYHCFVCGAQGSLRQLAEHLGVAVLQCCSVDGGDKRDIFSLADYAASKHLPADFLASLGLSDRKYQGKPAVRIPYFDESGAEVAVRYRVKPSGKGHTLSVKGGKLLPYGLWRLADARQAGYVLLVEGESDCQTLWHHGLPALGVPGAATWQEGWADHLAGLTVYLWQEPDQGGETLAARVGKSLPEVRILTAPPGCKDISEAHVLGKDVPGLLHELERAAIPWRELERERLNRQAAEAKHKAAALLACPDVLAEFAPAAQAWGLVGEEKTARLLYLALTSRLLDKPVSVGIKGPSSGGKSFTLATVLRAFPASAYHALSSLSERALAYSEEPLSHRFLVLYEADGLTSDFGQYLLRTLLSENHIRYETVEKTQDGLKPRMIEREGPTGLILTTTWASLHPENETRMFSVTVRDDPAQTQGVLNRLALQADGNRQGEPDTAAWHALQTWLELAGCREVSIPYAHDLAAGCDARAVRLRRDFGALLNLIRAHAILHQTQRERDEHGRIVATLADYAAVYALVVDIVSEGVQATVSPALRETVGAVSSLSVDGHPVSIAQLAARLGLDKGAVSRRVRVACEGGYLVNQEDRKGKPAKLVVGEPLPGESQVLPSPAELGEKNISFIPPCNTATLQQCNTQTQQPRDTALDREEPLLLPGIPDREGERPSEPSRPSEVAPKHAQTLRPASDGQAESVPSVRPVRTPGAFFWNVCEECSGALNVRVGPDGVGRCSRCAAKAARPAGRPVL